jgi:hypothetical protein
MLGPRWWRNRGRVIRRVADRLAGRSRLRVAWFVSRFLAPVGPFTRKARSGVPKSGGAEVTPCGGATRRSQSAQMGPSGV